MQFNDQAPRTEKGSFAKQATPSQRSYLKTLVKQATDLGVLTLGHRINVLRGIKGKASRSDASREISRLKAMIARAQTVPAAA